jgi:hypothetical protein
MNNPKAQSPTPELPVAHDLAQPDWAPPALDKLPVAGTAAANTGSDADGIDFSS